MTNTKSTHRGIRYGVILAAIFSLALQAAGAASSRPPNIVLMTADNLGYSDLGCFGNKENQTPEIDRLASQGVRLTSFYTAGATCTVSRATLLSGRYPQRIGLNHQLSVDENRAGIGLPHGEKLIPSYLKPLGYATACFGKWNIGFAPGSRPTERGFDEFFGHRSGNMDYYTYLYAGEHDLYRGVEPAHASGYATNLFAEAAVEFMRRHREKPFFLYLPFNAVHFPGARNKHHGAPAIWQAPAKFFQQYGFAPDSGDEKQRYQATVTALDAGVGRVLDQIDSLGLADNTIVIFYSDNGAFMTERKGLGVATNKPLRDGGNTLWEGGIRVAGMVRWPGRIAAGSVTGEPLISLDFLPMFLRAAGGQLPKDRILDGRDPTAALTGKAKSPRGELYWDYRGYSAVRSGSHKLLRVAPDKPFQLFDLAADLGESRDLSAEKPELVRRLQSKFEGWLGQFE